MRGRQKEIADIIGNDVTTANWRDWKWQLKHSIRDLETLEKVLDIKLPDKKREEIKKTIKRFPISVTPYYISLIGADDIETDPIYKQSIPSPCELSVDPNDMADPLAEDKDRPVELITHRYPDRVLFLVSNTCSMYCRHCTRKRKVGDRDYIPTKKALKEGINYIKKNPGIRDVLLSGGDPFLMPDEYIDWVLNELSAIKHLQIIRIGTRTPVVLPYRITDSLISVLKKHASRPLWINTHFNHPREMTTSARESLAKLADAGIPLGNQTVLLAGINDCPRIMKTLVHKLTANRVRPYYIYQCDLSEGLTHFRTPVGKGIEIIESLIGHTSGLAVPTYVIDAPGGGGKIPIMPNYLISWSTNKVILRNYEGVITTYKEPDSYEPIFCDRKCDNCKLQLNLEGSDEIRSYGIARLLADYDDTISLTPEKNERASRRKKNASG
ncbi:MAG TPA: lysine 2,3-aminomutase [Firmicutes bacterium]|nr:lysine 2,3-aminomutase [Bacillota bacterium]